MRFGHVCRDWLPALGAPIYRSTVATSGCAGLHLRIWVGSRGRGPTVCAVKPPRSKHHKSARRETLTGDEE